MTEAELNPLLDLRSENEHVEFKEAKNNFHLEKLVDYCVALAYEGGSRMVPGMTVGATVIRPSDPDAANKLKRYVPCPA